MTITVEDVLEGIEAAHARSTQSLDAPSTEDEGSVTLVETLGRTEAGYDRVEAEAAAARAELDEREWQVLRLRFVDELTQREIGRRTRCLADANLPHQSPRARQASAAVRGEQADGCDQGRGLGGSPPSSSPGHVQRGTSRRGCS